MLSRPAFRLSCVLVVSGQPMNGGGGTSSGMSPGGGGGSGMSSGAKPFLPGAAGPESERSILTATSKAVPTSKAGALTGDDWLNNAMKAYYIWSDASDAYKLSRFVDVEVEKSMCFGLETFWSGNLRDERHPDPSSLRDAYEKLSYPIHGLDVTEMCVTVYGNVPPTVDTGNTDYTSLVMTQKTNLLVKLKNLVNHQDQEEESYRTQLQEARDFWLYFSALIKSLSDSWSEDVGTLLRYPTQQFPNLLFLQDTTSDYTDEEKLLLNVLYFQKEIIPVAHLKLENTSKMIAQLLTELQSKQDNGLMGYTDSTGWMHIIQSAHDEQNHLLRRLAELTEPIALTSSTGSFSAKFLRTSSKIIGNVKVS